MKELSQEEIENLYQFTRQHYVEWYDLQTELVDHLANDIEEVMANDTDLSFEKAKQISFKKFGIFGFSDVIAQKQNALTKHYWRLVGKNILHYFTPPKIFILLCLIAITYSVLKWFEHPKFLLITFLVCVYLFVCIYLFRFNKKMKRKNEENKKKWLFEHLLLNLGGALQLVGVFIYFLSLVLKGTVWTDKNLLIYSILVVLIALISFILVVIIPKKMTQEMLKLYPDYQPLIKT